MDASGVRTWSSSAPGRALAEQILAELGGWTRPARYRIVELSADLRERQRSAPGALGRPTIRWLDALPDTLEAVVIGNEVLDAMPVQLVAFDGETWRERGVVASPEGFAFADRPTEPAPAAAGVRASAAVPGTVTEIHPRPRPSSPRWPSPQARRGLLHRLRLPEAEYYRPHALAAR